MKEEEIRDYLLGLTSQEQNSIIENLIQTDESFRKQVEDVAYFIEVSKRLMREQLKKELIEIGKKNPPGNSFTPFILLGLAIPLLGFLAYFLISGSQNKTPVLHSPKQDVIETTVVDTLPKTDTEKLVKEKLKSNFPYELPILATEKVKILSKQKDSEIIDGQTVSIRFMKTKSVNPEYQFERSLKTNQYQFVLKGDISEADVKKAKFIDLKNPQAPYKHARVGKNFYVINETQGTYVKFSEETNPVIQKELKSFWQRAMTFLRKIFKKKDK